MDDVVEGGAAVIVKVKSARGQDAREWSDICWAWWKKILANLDFRPSATIPCKSTGQDHARSNRCQAA